MDFCRSGNLNHAELKEQIVDISVPGPWAARDHGLLVRVANSAEPITADQAAL